MQSLTKVNESENVGHYDPFFKSMCSRLIIVRLVLPEKWS